MKQINIILNHFKTYHAFMGLKYLWYSCDGEVDYEDYPELQVEYDPDIAFFKCVEVMLTSGNVCLYFNSNCEDISLRGQHLSVSAQDQIELLKTIWIGKDAMDKMDEENDYLGWWFLIYCPYGMSHKIFDEHGKFIRWHYE